MAPLAAGPTLRCQQVQHHPGCGHKTEVPLPGHYHSRRGPAHCTAAVLDAAITTGTRRNVNKDGNRTTAYYCAGTTLPAVVAAIDTGVASMPDVTTDRCVTEGERDTSMGAATQAGTSVAAESSSVLLPAAAAEEEGVEEDAAGLPLVLSAGGQSPSATAKSCSTTASLGSTRLKRVLKRVKWANIECRWPCSCSNTISRKWAWYRCART